MSGKGQVSLSGTLRQMSYSARRRDHLEAGCTSQTEGPLLTIAGLQFANAANGSFPPFALCPMRPLNRAPAYLTTGRSLSLVV